MFTDGYALAIPVARLQSRALEVAPECASRADAELRRCATAVVRSEACPCLTGAPSVVEAVADDFCTWARDQDGPQQVAAQE